MTKIIKEMLPHDVRVARDMQDLYLVGYFNKFIKKKQTLTYYTGCSLNWCNM